jgi:dihydroorotase
MAWLLKSVTIVSPGSPLNGAVRDIHIENGEIRDIKANLKAGDAETIRIPGLCVSPGWVDLCADFRDPGEEYKEGLANGLDAAARGGFTHVVTMPGTHPAIDHRSKVEYILARSANHAVRVLPAATMSEKRAGEQLSELYDMQQAGAVLFTDDQPIERAELMRRALEYSTSLGALIGAYACDADLLGKGVMHEGLTSTGNGLKGIPEMVETIRLQRDLELLRYTGGRMHVMAISTAESVKLIREAKKSGLQVTCSVSANHLFFNDQALEGFDANLKVLPPFRDETDRKALIRAVNDGTIDAICSDHRPEDVEHKDREFVRATFGIGAIEQCFSAALAAGITAERFVERTAIAPREILGLSAAAIEKGAPADLTLFTANGAETIAKGQNISKAWNNPYLGHTLPGKVHGIIRGPHVVLV